jgi:hypothetical protein
LPPVLVDQVGLPQRLGQLAAADAQQFAGMVCGAGEPGDVLRRAGARAFLDAYGRA